MIHPLARWLACLSAAFLLACGGGGSSPPPATYTVGGSVSGLTNNGLVIGNGTDRVTLTAGATTFTMPQALADGSAYALAIASQPAHLQCSISHASGMLSGANVSNVQVSCVALTHRVGGTLSGLGSPGLVLANGADNVAVGSGAGTFSFAQPVAEGATYAVSVTTQPIGETCSVSGGSGTMGSADVTSIQVTCSTLSYSVGGTIGGLTASGLVLANGADTISPAAGATVFTLPAAVPYGGTYNVTIAQQPAGLNCSVAGSFPATMGAGNVTNVAVTCQAAVGVVPFAGQDICPSDPALLFADGQGSAASIPNAISMSFDAAGNLYLSEGTVLRRVTPGGLVSTVAGQPLVPGNVDGTGSAATFQFTNGLTAEAGGNLYVANSNTVRTVTAAGQVSTLAGNKSISGYQNGTGSAAAFNAALGVARDSVGNLYAVEVNNNDIRKITPAGVVTSFSGRADLPAAFVDGAAGTARFNQPTDIVIDSHGVLYVADTGNNAIRKIATDGSVTTVAGASTGQAGFVDGSGGSARLMGPTRLAIGPDDTVYVLDQRFGSSAVGGEAVRVLSTSGTVTTLGVTQYYEVLHPSYTVPPGVRLRIPTPLASNPITGVGAGTGGITYVGYGCAVHRINP